MICTRTILILSEGVPSDVRSKAPLSRNRASSFSIDWMCRRVRFACKKHTISNGLNKSTLSFIRKIVAPKRGNKANSTVHFRRKNFVSPVNCCILSHDFCTKFSRLASSRLSMLQPSFFVFGYVVYVRNPNLNVRVLICNILLFLYVLQDFSC